MQWLVLLRHRGKEEGGRLANSLENQSQYIIPSLVTDGADSTFATSAHILSQIVTLFWQVLKSGKMAGDTHLQRPNTVSRSMDILSIKRSSAHRTQIMANAKSTDSHADLRLEQNILGYQNPSCHFQILELTSRFTADWHYRLDFCPPNLR